MLYTREMYRDLRRKLKAAGYNEQDLLDALNSAQDTIAARSLCLKDTTSFTAPTTAPTAGSYGAYATIPSDCIAPYAAVYNDGSDNVSDVKIITVEELHRDRTGWREYSTADVPRYIFEERGQWGTYPQMETDNAGTVYVHYHKRSRPFVLDSGYYTANSEAQNYYTLTDATKKFDTNQYKDGILWGRLSTGVTKSIITSNTATTITVPTSYATLPSAANYEIESASELNDSYEQAILALATYKLTGDAAQFGLYQGAYGQARVASKPSIRMVPYT